MFIPDPNRNWISKDSHFKGTITLTKSWAAVLWDTREPSVTETYTWRESKNQVVRLRQFSMQYGEKLRHFLKLFWVDFQRTMLKDNLYSDLLVLWLIVASNQLVVNRKLSFDPKCHLFLSSKDAAWPAELLWHFAFVNQHLQFNVSSLNSY